MATTHTAENVQWLLEEFVERTGGVAHAVTVSADGLCIAHSSTLHKDYADHLAAITSGIVSLTEGTATQFGCAPVLQTTVQMNGLYLLLMSISDGSHLAVLASDESDIGAVGFGMVRLVEQVGESAFTPELREAHT